MGDALHRGQQQGEPSRRRETQPKFLPLPGGDAVPQCSPKLVFASAGEMRQVSLWELDPGKEDGGCDSNLQPSSIQGWWGLLLSAPGFPPPPMLPAIQCLIPILLLHTNLSFGGSSEISPRGGPFGMPRTKPGVATCKTVTLPTELYGSRPQSSLCQPSL